MFLLTTDIRTAEPQSPAMAVDNKTESSEVCNLASVHVPYCMPMLTSQFDQHIVVCSLVPIIIIITSSDKLVYCSPNNFNYNAPRIILLKHYVI